MTGTDLATLAARGDAVAQRQLRDGFLDLAKQVPTDQSADSFAAAEVFARLVVEHTDPADPADLKMLAAILFKRAEASCLNHGAALALTAEAVKILTPLHLAADDQATWALSTLAEQEGAEECFALASRMTLSENPALEVVAGAC